MKPKKPAATHAAQTGQCTDLEIKGSRLEDWIDKADLMQQFHISARTVDNYIAKGILTILILASGNISINPISFATSSKRIANHPYNISKTKDAASQSGYWVSIPQTPQTKL